MSVKRVEIGTGLALLGLLAAPLAVLSSAGLLWLAEHGLPGRVAASGVATGVFFWGAWRAIAAYLERFVAVGR